MEVSRRKVTLMLIGLGVMVVSARPNVATASTINAEAIADFQVGKWRDAANQAARLSDADNLAFAARSLLASAMLSATSATRTADIAQARQFAEAALTTQPRHIEARLQLATALGLQARTGSPARAFAAGIPQRVKRLLEAVSRDAPTQAWTYALLGAWHLEGLRIGGQAARAMLGVNVIAGRTAFARAMRLDPTIAATPFYFAASLLALDPNANSAEARGLLVRAAATPAKDAFQNEVRARAQTLQQTLDAQGPAKAAAMALAWL
jgi:hypothetical protein